MQPTIGPRYRPHPPMSNTLLTFKNNEKKIPRKQHFYKNLLSLAWKNLSSYMQVFTVNAGVEKIRYTQSECEKAFFMVWFERSLHSAQVSGQNLMTLQVEEGMWTRTGDYGRLLGKWVKGKQKLCFV